MQIKYPLIIVALIAVSVFLLFIPSLLPAEKNVTIEMIRSNLNQKILTTKGIIIDYNANLSVRGVNLTGVASYVFNGAPYYQLSDNLKDVDDSVFITPQDFLNILKNDSINSRFSGDVAYKDRGCYLVQSNSESFVWVYCLDNITYHPLFYYIVKTDLSLQAKLYYYDLFT